MQRLTTRLTGLALLLFLSTGCASLWPGSHESFDQWYVGEPESDYEIIELEGRASWQVMLHSYLLWPAFAVRDGVRIGMIPFTAPYYTVKAVTDDE